MTGVIYTITNIINNKIYLGSTINFEHLARLKNNKHHSLKLQNAYNKYGINSFRFDIMYFSKDIRVDEQKELDKLNLRDTYNILATSTGGDVITYHPNREEILKKISRKAMGRKPGNSLKVTINGVNYDSYNEASRELNIPVVTIRYRCLSLNNKYSSWNIVGKEKALDDLYLEGEKHGIVIICDGITYASYAEAARQLGITDTSVRYRVMSNNYPNCYLG